MSQSSLSIWVSKILKIVNMTELKSLICHQVAWQSVSSKNFAPSPAKYQLLSSCRHLFDHFKLNSNQMIVLNRHKEDFRFYLGSVSFMIFWILEILKFWILKFWILKEWAKIMIKSETCIGWLIMFQVSIVVLTMEYVLVGRNSFQVKWLEWQFHGKPILEIPPRSIAALVAIKVNLDLEVICLPMLLIF